MSAGAADRRPLNRAALDARPFAPALCETLFEAVLIDDEVDADLHLPDAIQFDHDQDKLVACFRLARQLWIEGFDRDLLIRLTGSLIREGDPGTEDRIRLKHVRAKFKHFRYAYALYGAAHR